MKIILEPIQAVCLLHFLQEAKNKLDKKTMHTFHEKLLSESIGNYVHQIEHTIIDGKEIIETFDRLENQFYDTKNVSDD